MKIPNNSIPPPSSLLSNNNHNDRGATRQQQTSLLLDSQIRDWVVLPLLVIMISAGLLRTHVSKLLRPPPKPISHIDARAKSVLLRTSRLRSGSGGYITRQHWEARRLAWSGRNNINNNNNNNNHNTTGWLRQEALLAETEKKTFEALQTEKNGGNNHSNDPLSAAMLPGMDPSTMMDGMKGNMAAMVQNMVMMQGISHFFRGFVLVKVPFPLTRGFKQMFQRGLFDLTTLDTSYVSSVSWYFLVMFGLRAFFRLALGEPLQEEVEGYEVQKELGMEYGGGGGGGPPGGQFDAAKALVAEADNLELMNVQSRGSTFKLDEAERNLLGRRYPKKKRKRIEESNGEDVLFGLSSGKNKALTPSIRSKKKD